ncbi:MAG: zinc ribbon domain-containing protein [Thermoproteota archaeon]|nr:zinc ribbon domain-containing protein [Thermoproteota archaeon]
MQTFFDKLKEGKFLLPICTLCKSKVWPPTSYCPNCLSSTSLEIVDLDGTLLYFTQSYVKGLEGAYGLVEMSGIRLIGSFDNARLKDGLKVKMVRCGLTPNGSPFYFFEPIEG